MSCPQYSCGISALNNNMVLQPRYWSLTTRQHSLYRPGHNHSRIHVISRPTMPLITSRVVPGYSIEKRDGSIIYIYIYIYATFITNTECYNKAAQSVDRTLPRARFGLECRIRNNITCDGRRSTRNMICYSPTAYNSESDIARWYTT